MVADDEHLQDYLSGPLTTEEKRALVERTYDAFNGFDLEGVVDALHQDCSYRVIAAGQVVASAEGHDAIRAMLFHEGKHSSSRKKTVMEMFVRGERLMLEIRYSRVLAIAEHDLKVGDIESMDGIAEVAFRDRLIAEYIEIFA